MDAQREALLLDECLRRLQAGESVEACLAHLRPAEADALRPILETAFQVRQLRTPPPPPNPAKRAAGRALFLAEAARLFPATAPNGHVHASPERLMALVETVVARVRAGASLEECLADHPDHAHDLRPLVETALDVKASFPTPPPADPDKRAAARAQFLAEAARLFEDQVMAGLVRAELRDIQAVPQPVLAEEREGRLMGLVDAVMARVRAGASLDACLADYPAEAAQLRPLVQTALGMADSFEAPPAPSAAKRAAARARFLAAAQADAAAAPVPALTPEAVMTVVDAIVARVRTGASLDACLAEHAAHAAELRPLVETALGVSASFAPAPAPDPAKRAAARARFLAAAQAQTDGAATPVQQPVPVAVRPPSSVLRPASPWSALAAQARQILAAFLNMGSGFQRVGLAGATVFLVLCMAATGVVSVSAASLPGDPLYTVKEATRVVQLALTFDPEERERVAETQERAKQDEILQAAERRVRAGEPVQAPTFTDIVTEIDPTGLVRVGKVLVRLQPGMAVEVGSRVQVKGTVGPDGVVQVTQVVVLAKPATQVVEKPATAAPAQSAAQAAAPTPTLPAPTATGTTASAALVKPTDTPTDAPTSQPSKPSPAPTTPAPTATERLLPTATATARLFLAPSATATTPVEAVPTESPATVTPEPSATQPPERPRAERTSGPTAIDVAGFFVGGSSSGATEVWRIIGDGQKAYEIELGPQTAREGSAPRAGDTVLARGVPVNDNRIRASRVKVTSSVGTSRPGEPTPASVTVRGKVEAMQRLSDREAIWTLSVDGGRRLTVYETSETAEVSGITGNVVGRTATVTYRVVNGQNVAERIRVESGQNTTVVHSVITEMHADHWIVGNTRVQITDETVVTPSLADYTPQPFVDWANVTALLENGVLRATRIEVERVPTRTPLPPTATHTPLPPTATWTNTPVPPSPTRTNTPVPPPTRTNTPVPPSATPRPVEAFTVTPKPTEAPSATPKPTEATSKPPAPTATAAK